LGLDIGATGIKAAVVDLASGQLVTDRIRWLSCAPHDDSWLAPPAISYTPWSVTITMHTTDAFAATTTCGGGNDNTGMFGIMRDVGIPVAVQLREPLGGRALFDGSSSPSAARPYR
jgi:hypothetical protein